VKINKAWIRLVIIIVASNFMASFASSKEIALGSTKAPVTLVEYGSLTCDYCIAFHNNILPRVKKHYIDAGTVRFIYRHFPTSKAATHAAVAAQCSGDKFYEMLDELYSTIPGWYQAEDRNGVFVKKAKSLGLNSEVFLSCLSDAKNLDDIVSQQLAARNDVGVIGTPTFVINGYVVRGKKTFAQMKALINEALDKEN